MLRIFIDLWLKKRDPIIEDTLAKLGYRAAAVEDTGYYNSSNKITVVKKIVIKAYSREELRKMLHGIKSGEPKIVTVYPIGVEAARMAAHDNRVDTIVIMPDNYKLFDKHQFTLMKQFSKPLELPLRVFTDIDSRRRAAIFRRVYYYVHRTGLPLMISSCAESYEDLMIPHSVISLFSILLNIRKKEVLLWLTNCPLEVLKKNGVLL
ncbi:MAG: RNase P subunit p30 [Thermoprotei archaeon]